jgi:hypothetical protein
VRREFQEGDAAVTAHARGQALESILVYIFQKFPGVRFIDRDILVADGSEEIDLIFWNDRHSGGLDFLPNILLFECKNWAAPVGSNSVTGFINKVRRRHLEYGFLIASNGITGNAEDLNAAHRQIHDALIADNLKIVVLDRAEISAIGSTQQLVAVLQQKIARIILRVA